MPYQLRATGALSIIWRPLGPIAPDFGILIPGASRLAPWLYANVGTTSRGPYPLRGAVG